MNLLGFWSEPVASTSNPFTPRPRPNIPKPPPITGDELTVSDAWALFGVTNKRGTRDDVKRRYLAFVASYHPDLPDAPPDANSQLKKANAAWALLQKHCRW